MKLILVDFFIFLGDYQLGIKKKRIWYMAWYYTDNDVFLADNVVLADISVLFADIMTFFHGLF